MNNESAQVSFDIIGAVGLAKSCFIEAIRNIAKGDIEEAERLYEEGNNAFIEGHKAHAAVLSKFAAGEDVPIDILLVHAECQMMSAEDFKTIAEELISMKKEGK